MVVGLVAKSREGAELLAVHRRIIDGVLQDIIGGYKAKVDDEIVVQTLH